MSGTIGLIHNEAPLKMYVFIALYCWVTLKNDGKQATKKKSLKK